MNYAEVKYCDIANGLGCRTVLFVSGCRNACKGCFQPETWAFDFGSSFDEEIQKQIIDSLAPAYVQGLTLLGGDPFEEENQRALLPFVRQVKEKYPSKDIWAYTGYILDRDLVENGRKYTEATEELLSYIDILVDGPFMEDRKNLKIQFRGSENQRIIDMNESRRLGEIVLSPLNAKGL